MKYRIKEVISNNKTRFYVQRYNMWFGWGNFHHRMDGDYNVFDTLIKAQDCIKEIIDRKTTDIKYHYQ